MVAAEKSIASSVDSNRVNRPFVESNSVQRASGQSTCRLSRTLRWAAAECLLRSADHPPETDLALLISDGAPNGSKAASSVQRSLDARRQLAVQSVKIMRKPLICADRRLPPDVPTSGNKRRPLFKRLIGSDHRPPSRANNNTPQYVKQPHLLQEDY
jgi:hypothetical protein